MALIVTLDGKVLHGEQGAQALSFVTSYFERADATPEAAAYAYDSQQELLERGVEFSEEDGRLFDLWNLLPDALAQALGMPGSRIDVQLIDDK